MLQGSGISANVDDNANASVKGAPYPEQCRLRLPLGSRNLQTYSPLWPPPLNPHYPRWKRKSRSTRTRIRLPAAIANPPHPIYHPWLFPTLSFVASWHSNLWEDSFSVSFPLHIAVLLDLPSERCWLGIWVWVCQVGGLVGLRRNVGWFPGLTLGSLC